MVLILGRNMGWGICRLILRGGVLVGGGVMVSCGGYGGGITRRFNGHHLNEVGTSGGALLQQGLHILPDPFLRVLQILRRTIRRRLLVET